MSSSGPSAALPGPPQQPPPQQQPSQAPAPSQPQPHASQQPPQQQPPQQQHQHQQQPPQAPQAPQGPPPLGTAGAPAASAGSHHASPTLSLFLQQAANPNSRKLYVGNLDFRVTEAMLHQLFSPLGDIAAVKIVHERSTRTPQTTKYGFVEYQDHRSAEQAIQQLAGFKMFSNELRINWAIPSSQPHKNEIVNHHHIFVGDLGPGVTDQILAKAFSQFGTLSDARVMWDHTTGKSRGYGFVAFRERKDAERAISEMNGEWLGNRPIRCNWANQKSQPEHSTTHTLTYEAVAAESSPFNTTVYVGNLAPGTSQQQIARLFQPFGYISELRMQGEKGYAFVKLDSHQNAAMAIVTLNGTVVNSRSLKCSWGRERAQDSTSSTSGMGGGAGSSGFYTSAPAPPFTYTVPYGYFSTVGHGFAQPGGNVAMHSVPSGTDALSIVPGITASHSHTPFWSGQTQQLSMPQHFVPQDSAIPQQSQQSQQAPGQGQGQGQIMSPSLPHSGSHSAPASSTLSSAVSFGGKVIHGPMPTLHGHHGQHGHHGHHTQLGHQGPVGSIPQQQVPGQVVHGSPQHPSPRQSKPPVSQ
ncbi:E3 ubiquitin-protein ligase pub1 [Polyrhizophydium stewartii]|uniref:E3 ubiquitin-protein ligase pub1 n=1 Tax=Polyrhizophydium stewartii TaxID=2732419 RepID=A0ABR4MWK2_9FUNG